MSAADADFFSCLEPIGSDLPLGLRIARDRSGSSGDLDSSLNDYPSPGLYIRPRKRALSEDLWKLHQLQGMLDPRNPFSPNAAAPAAVGGGGEHLQGSVSERGRLIGQGVTPAAGARGQDATIAVPPGPPQGTASAAWGLFQGNASARAQGTISAACALAQGTSHVPGSLLQDTTSEAAARAQLTLAEIEQQLLGDGNEYNNSREPASSELHPQEEALENLLLGSSPSKSALSVDRQALTSDWSAGDCHNSPSSYAPSQRKLLIACASAVSEGDFENAEGLLAELSPMASLYGDHMQRLTTYFSNALRARIHRQSKQGQASLTKPLPPPPTSKSIVGMQALYRTAHYKFGYMAANSVIIETLRGENKVHILDLDIGHGTQWVAMLRAFAARPGGPPQLRITGVAGPQLLAYKGGIQILGKRLEDFAKTLNMQFEFCPLEMEATKVQESMIERRAGEALAVNMAFYLHRVPDESVCTTNPRDCLLRMVHALGPRVVTLVEHEANTNSAPFLRRFTEALNKYVALFESIHTSPPNPPPQRESNTDNDPTNIEEHCLAESILSTVAYDGPERIERYEWFAKWHVRMHMAGFHLWPISPFISKTMKTLVRQCQGKYLLLEEGGALHLGWSNTVLVVASAWKA